MDYTDDERNALRVWALAKGSGHYRRTCLSCSETRKNRRAATLSVDVDHEKAMWICFHCDAKGAVRLDPHYRSDHEPASAPPDRKPKPVQKGVVRQTGTSLDAVTRAYLKGRNISEATAMAFGVVHATAYFPELKREALGISFPYIVNGREQGHKIKCVEEKANVCDATLASLCGLQLVDMEKSSDIIICEGEPDMLSFYEAGVMNATSVPNGASSFTRDDPKDSKTTMAFLWSAKEKIDKAKRIIIASDDDGPGVKLGEELARRIGKHRCWKIAYPEGCKDGNDVLVKHGAAKLKEIVELATPWPVEGLFEASMFTNTVTKLYEEGLGDRILTGMPPIDDLYSCGPGMLTVMTGIPGHGKSTLVDFMMLNLARRHGSSFAICSFENPVEVHIAKLCEMMTQKHFFKTDKAGERMTRDEMEACLPFINEHFKFLSQDDGKKATLESIIERIKTAVFRWGVSGAVIDPYNYIARPHKDDTETQFIDDMLTQLRLMAQYHGIHLWLVAHPTKLVMEKDGNYPPPRGYSISGCYSEDTEVLTSDGWVPHPEVTLDHRVACFDPGTSDILYARPSVVHRYPFKGDMHHWIGGSLDLMVTPNHRMLVKPVSLLRPKKGSKITGRPPTWKRDEWQFVESQDIPRSRWALPLSANRLLGGSSHVIALDGGYDPLAFWRFVGFWIAEGWVSMGALVVCQADRDSELPKQIVVAMAKPFGESVTHYRQEELPMWTARFIKSGTSELTAWVVENCKTGAPNKRLPATVFTATADEKQALFEGLMLGDGSHSGNCMLYHTTSPGLADDVQRLAIELGMNAKIYAYDRAEPHHHDRYTVHMRTDRERTIEPQRNLVEVPYDGEVFCLTVPTGAYITRRNGRMAICGNSNAWYAKADFGLTVYRVPDKPGQVKFINWKTRWDWMGKEGESELLYDPATNVYLTSAMDDLHPYSADGPTTYRDAKEGYDSPQGFKFH